MNIATIILAAGNSSRLGQAKQLVPRGNTTMIEYVYQVCHDSSTGPIQIITGAFHAEIAALLPKAPIIYNPNWEDGMGSTIAFALQNLEKESIDGLIIVLSDQVYLESKILKKLLHIASTTNSKIIQCQYQEGMGPPTYFDKSTFVELEQLSGDLGARSIVKKYASATTIVTFEMGNIDLDYPSDLTNLTEL